jgi:hypothetical protein
MSDGVAGKVSKTVLSLEKYSDFIRPTVSVITENNSITAKIIEITDTGMFLDRENKPRS